MNHNFKTDWWLKWPNILTILNYSDSIPTRLQPGPLRSLEPGMLALASTWDENLVALVAAAIATEFKARAAAELGHRPCQMRGWKMSLRICYLNRFPGSMLNNQMVLAIGRDELQDFRAPNF